MSEHLTWQSFEPRSARLGQRPVIAWLTGLPGAGKTSIAAAADRALGARGRHGTVLDGDNLRHGLNRDLGFNAADRAENVRRTAEAARLMAEAGLIVIVALISPSRGERASARRIAGDAPFLEAFVGTPPALCEARDPKGLYALAHAGRIVEFTGVSAPYEVPTAPDLVLRTEGLAIEESAAALVEALLRLSASTA